MSSILEWIMLLIDRGGPVMIALFALSVVSFSLIGERVWFWFANNRRSHRIRESQLIDAFQTGDQNAVRNLAGHHQSPCDQLAKAMINRGHQDAIAQSAIENERPRIERFMVSLSTIITAAPLLGILGTVIGIIHSFRLLGEQSVLTDPRDISLGIAEALLTTAFGLIIALFTLFPYMAFRARVDRIMARLETMVSAAQHGLNAEKSAGVKESISKSDENSESTGVRKEFKEFATTRSS